MVRVGSVWGAQYQMEVANGTLICGVRGAQHLSRVTGQMPSSWFGSGIGGCPFGGVSFVGRTPAKRKTQTRLFF